MLIVDPHILQQTMLKSVMRRIQCLITAINAEINFICGDLVQDCIFIELKLVITLMQKSVG